MTEAATEWRVIFVLMVLVASYMSIGGVVFNALEGANEQQSIAGNKQFVYEFILNNSCVTEAEFDELVAVITESYAQGVYLTGGVTTATNWDIPNAIFFCSSVITTIGYGMLAPATFSGKIFCILYAIIGIPMFFLLMHGFGQKIYQFNSFIAAKVNCFPRNPRLEAISDFVVVMLIGITLMVLLPAAVYTFTEDWDMSTSVYYCITTVSTIGFGDYVAGESMADGSLRSWYRLGIILWMSVGVAWWAGCLGVVQKNAIDSIAVGTNKFNKRARAHIKANTRRLSKLWEEGEKRRASVVTVSEDYTVICADKGIIRDYNYSWTHHDNHNDENINGKSYSTYL